MRDVLGIHIEEFAPPADPSITGGSVPTLEIAGLAAGTAREWGEIVRVAGADVRSTFVGGMLDGLPAITRAESGAGVAWYVATAPDNLRAVVDEVLAAAGVTSIVSDQPAGVEVVQRGDRRFYLNWNTEAAEVDGLVLPPYGAAISRG